MSKPLNYQVQLVQVAATITASDSVTGVLDFGGLTPVAVVMPTGWDAAALSFVVSHTGATGELRSLYAGATERTIAVGTNRFVALTPTEFSGVRFMQIRSGTATLAVVQTVTRSLSVIARPV